MKNCFIFKIAKTIKSSLYLSSNIQATREITVFNKTERSFLFLLQSIYYDLIIGGNSTKVN